MTEFLKDIIDDIVFNPSFVTWACPKCEKKFKHENCLGDGKYCITHHQYLDKDYDFFDFHPTSQGEMNGRDQLVEMLRQHCLSEQLQGKGETI